MGGYLMSDDNEILVDLQTRLAFQDHTITDLNDVIADQQKQIDTINLRLKMLDDKLRSLEESVDTGRSVPQHEKPPHY